jgi:hypothetical protein
MQDLSEYLIVTEVEEAIEAARRARRIGKFSRTIGQADESIVREIEILKYMKIQ